MFPSIEQVHVLAPLAKKPYTDSFADAATILDPFGINTPLRVAHFMAQILHESGAFTILVESLNYSTPERLMAVWPSRFPSKEEALPFVHNSFALAEHVYSGRMGNVKPGDGARYVGRGPLQVTGHDSYLRIGTLLGIDLVNNPDLAITAPYLLQIAACEWKESRCNEAADDDNLLHVSGRINIGKDVNDPHKIVGYNERAAWLKRTKAVWR